MKKGCLVALGIPVGVVALLVGYLWLSFYNVNVRYRITVDVQDGDQIKTGSSVINSSFNIEPDWSPSHFNALPTVNGYAPIVDLGKKGLLFLTFTDPERTQQQGDQLRKVTVCPFEGIACLPFAGYHVSLSTDMSEKRAALRKLLSQSGPRDVPFVALTRLIRFVDVNGQYRYVDVAPDDLTASFGPGVELKRVVVQLTDDPVAPRPENWPQWLGDTDWGALRGH